MVNQSPIWLSPVNGTRDWSGKAWQIVARGRESIDGNPVPTRKFLPLGSDRFEGGEVTFL